MDLFLTGWKNVFRNRRRSILNIIALTVGISIMILGLGWVEGYGTYIYRAIIDYDTGELQLLRERYLEEEARLPLDITVDRYGELRELLLGHEKVIGASGRIDFAMSLSSGRASTRVQGRAIDPAAEAEVTVIDRHIVGGSYLTDAPGILIGKPLAEKMDVAAGDTMFVTAMNRHSVENFIDVRVVGIYHLGYPAMDENLVYMDLATAQELLALENAVSRIVMRLAPGTGPDAVRPGIERLLNRWTERTDALVVRSWRRFAREAVSAIEADVFSFWIMLGILYLLIVLGILNSMSMSVFERTGEIGTLRAIGMKRAGVYGLFASEALGISLIASLCALLVSLPVAAWLQFGGIDIGSMMPEDLPIPFGERFHADFRLVHFAGAVTVAAATAVTGALLPARRAARMRVADAMRG